MAKDTLFTNDGGGGSSNSSGQYVQDVFRDVVLPATSNSGLTDTALTNPIGAKVGNSDVPRFGTKTLWVKDVVLIDDRSKWIDGVPTYRVIWNEDFPAAIGYIQSTEAPTPVKLSNAKKTVFEMNSGQFGVICKARKVGFFVQGMTTAASSATIFLDRVSTGQTVDITGIGAAALIADQMQYNFNVSGAANASDDLHNFSLAPAPARVEGVIIYFENTTQDIAVGPGTAYVNKTAATTTVETNVALPSFGSSLGGVSVVTKGQGGAYSLVSQDARTQVSIGQGTNGTSVLNMSVGTGASFPVGTGLALHQGGGSFYVGSVVSVSTDALTVSPVLPFGASNTVYRSWLSGQSLSVGASYMELATSINFTPYLGMTTPLLDPSGNWAIWSQNCGISTIVTGTTASVSSDVMAIAGSSGFIQVQGLFSGAELEFFESPGGPFWGTFMVNGLPAFSIATGAFGTGTSTKKQTVFTEAGGGWNSFKLSFGKTMSPRAISKINLYRRRNDGASFGNLASLEKFQEFADRPLASGALALGTGRRIYSDQLFLEDSAGVSPDAWLRETNETAAGGIRYLGSTTTCTFNQRFYGKNFALIGTAPTGATLTMDGAGVPLASAFNRMVIGATEMFHTVTYAHRSGTSIIEAFDFSRTFGDVRWLGTSAAINLQKKTIQVPYGTPWRTDNSVTPYGFGSITNFTCLTRRNLDCFEAKGIFTTGTTNGTTLGAFGVPFPIDLSKVFNNIDCGRAERFVSRGIYTNGDAYWLFSDAATTNQIFMTDSSSLTGFTMSVGSNLSGNNQVIGFNLSVPIQGWDASKTTEVDQ